MDHPDDAGVSTRPQPSREDFEAAEAMIARHQPDAPAEGTPEHAHLLARCTAAIEAYGERLAPVLIGLRAPRTRQEELALAAHTGAITDDEYQQQLAEHTERPVDRDMLDELGRAWNRRLDGYAELLSTVTKIATGQRGADAEPEVDAAARRLKARSAGAVHPREYDAVRRFLAAMRASHGPVRCDGFPEPAENAHTLAAENAHTLAMSAFVLVGESWKESKRIAAHRAETDPARLLYDDLIATGKLPDPFKLRALLEQERAWAADELERRAGSAPASASGGEGESGGAVALTDAALTVLLEIAGSPALVTAADLSGRSGLPGRDRTREVLNHELADAGLIHRPKGERKGWAATKAGHDLLRSRGMHPRDTQRY